MVFSLFTGRILRFQEAKIGSLKFKLVLLSFLGFLLFLVADAFLMDSVFSDLIPSGVGVTVSDVVAIAHPPCSDRPSCPGPCDTDTVCGFTCHGSDYFKCGYCDQSSTSTECHGMNVDDYVCPTKEGDSCINCWYGSYDRSNKDGEPEYHCEYLNCTTDGGDYLASGEGYDFSEEYGDDVPFGKYSTTSFGQYECCRDDRGEYTRSFLQGCTNTRCGNSCSGNDCTLDCSGRSCLGSCTGSNCTLDCDSNLVWDQRSNSYTTACNNNSQCTGSTCAQRNCSSNDCTIECEMEYCKVSCSSYHDPKLSSCHFGCTGPDCVGSVENNFAFPIGTSGTVCCGNGNDAVYNGRCYSPNLAYQLGQGHSGISENGIERPNVYVDSMGTWYDCDESSYACTNRCSNVINTIPPFDWDLNWTRSGEISVGEYDKLRSTECCGDDSHEFWNYRSTGCKYELGCGTTALDADSNDNWPRPYFRADIDVDVCCDDDDDAVFQSTCYPEGPYKFTGWPVPSGLNTPNLVAKAGVWYDCDSDENTCTDSRRSGYCGLNWTKTGEYIVCGEYPALPGTPRGPYGGGPAEPLHNTSILKECCGDDPGEIYVNTSQTSQGITDTFAACCNSANDCVDFDGDCVGHCQFSQKDDFQIGKSLNFSDYQCILGDWWPKISGTVKNVYNQPIQGAEVRVVGAYFRGGHVGTWNTDSAGEYYIYVPNGTYDVIASKIAGSNIFYGYEDTVFFSVDIQEPVQVDFVLRNRSTDCTAACTRSDGLCHASCDGLSGCSNFIAACDLAAPGIIRTGIGGTGQSLNCCNNATVPSRLPADVSVCGDNVVKFVRPVVLRGQLVNMVLVVFEGSPDC